MADLRPNPSHRGQDGKALLMALIVIAVAGAAVAGVVYRQEGRVAAAKLTAASANVRLASDSSVRLLSQLMAYPEPQAALSVRPVAGTAELPAFFVDDYLSAAARLPGNIKRIIPLRTGSFGGYLVTQPAPSQFVIMTPSTLELNKVDRAAFFSPTNALYGLSNATGTRTTIEDLGSEPFDAADPNPQTLKRRRFRVTTAEQVTRAGGDASRQSTFDVELGLPAPPEPDCDVSISPTPAPGVGVPRNAPVDVLLRTYGVVRTASVVVVKGGVGGTVTTRATLTPENGLVSSTLIPAGAPTQSLPVVADPAIVTPMATHTNMTVRGSVKGVNDWDSVARRTIGARNCTASAVVAVQNPPAVAINGAMSGPGCVRVTVNGGGYNITKVAIRIPSRGINVEAAGTSWTRDFCGLNVDSIAVSGASFSPTNGWSAWKSRNVGVSCRYAFPTYYISYRGYYPWNPHYNPCGSDACLNHDTGGGLIVGHSVEIACPANAECGMIRPSFSAGGLSSHNGATSFYIPSYYLGNSCGDPVAVWTRGGGCFTPDTKILLADGREKRVDNLADGDEVLNPLTGRARRVTKIVAGPEHRPMHLVETGKGRLIVTEDHPFVTTEGLKRADTLRKGDRLVDGGAGTEVVRVGRRSVGRAQQDVWNFELEGEVSSPEDFVVVANGIPTGEMKLQTFLKRANKDVEVASQAAP